MVVRGCDPERIEVCYTNIDARDAAERPSRAELSLPEGVPIIVYPVRMSEQKQPFVFAKTMLELRRRGHEFLALAVGTGPYLPRLRGFVRRTRLAKHVRCLGVQPNARVQELIAAADCVFIPSTNEGISLAFYEALAAGVPAVGADVGGQRELVTPECGILVRRADEATEVRRYADAIGELLDDPSRRRAMGEAGRARIREHFTLDEMGELMEELLARAAELAASDPRPVPSANDAHSAALDGVRLVNEAQAARTEPVGTRMMSVARVRGLLTAGRAGRRSKSRSRVVFISGEPGFLAGHRYRVLNIASALPPRYFETVVIRLDELGERLGELHPVDVLWVWRSRYLETLAKAIDGARAAGARIVCDVDDLVFRPELARPDVIDGLRTQKLAPEDLARHFASTSEVAAGGRSLHRLHRAARAGARTPRAPDDRRAQRLRCGLLPGGRAGAF